MYTFRLRVLSTPAAGSIAMPIRFCAQDQKAATIAVVLAEDRIQSLR